jgi:hypothetical protein
MFFNDTIYFDTMTNETLSRINKDSARYQKNKFIPTKKPISNEQLNKKKRSRVYK